MLSKAIKFCVSPFTLGAVVVAGYALKTETPPSKMDTQQLSDFVKAKPKEARETCLTGFDKHVFEFAWAVKDKLKDPDSFDHVQTLVTYPTPAGIQTVRMTYRAKNSFGALVLERAEAQVNIRGCDVVTWSRL